MARLKRNMRTAAPLQSNDVIDYFALCLSEGDTDLIVAALGDIVRAQGLSEVAQNAGLSEDYLCQILSEEGNPKFSTIAKVVKALGLTLYAGSAVRRELALPYSTDPQNDAGKKSVQPSMLSSRIALNDAINKAGRQRMLSQQMAKCYFQIGQAIDADSSRHILNASLMKFESQLEELKVFAPTQDINAVLINLEQAWHRYKRVLANTTPNQHDARLVLMLNEEILVMAQESTDQLERVSRTTAGKVVNIAGRQRMLSQRMAKFYQALNWGIAEPDTFAKLTAARKEFIDTLDVLEHFPKNTPDIRNELDIGKRQWAIFDQALQLNVSLTEKRSLLASNVALFSERILEVLDRLTCRYTKLA
jgi:probable addiction module antidote protein